MINKEWNGLLKILEIEHVSQDGNVLWSATNMYNVFHLAGEEFLLNAVFKGGTTNTYIPENYYFGLDNRTSISANNIISNLSGEPSTNGYARIPVSSTGVFNVTLQSSHYRAEGPILSFSASGGAWGPVRNLFLTTQVNNSGVLISSVSLGQVITVSNGEAINMRMGLSLRDCS